jgi:hypothetical protein
MARRMARSSKSRNVAFAIYYPKIHCTVCKLGTNHMDFAMVSV